MCVCADTCASNNIHVYTYNTVCVHVRIMCVCVVCMCVYWNGLLDWTTGQEVLYDIIYVHACRCLRV